MKHTWDYCGLCRAPFVKCATCGNNCCNGGYGSIDGKECPDCPSAYEMQDSTESPVFSETYKAKRHTENRIFAPQGGGER
jgi:hypothetical protein